MEKVAQFESNNLDLSLNQNISILKNNNKRKTVISIYVKIKGI